MTSVPLVVPSSTPASSPIRQALGVSSLRQLVILVPQGHAGLTGIALWWNGRVYWPDAGEWVRGNDETLTVPITGLDSIPSNQRPELRAFNDDDTYPHTFYVRAS